MFCFPHLHSMHSEEYPTIMGDGTETGGRAFYSPSVNESESL